MLNVNFGSGNLAEATCRGGAGGVTGLTSEGVIREWFGGSAYHHHLEEFNSTLILASGTAVSLEFDAGTGGKVSVNFSFYFALEE